MDPNINYLAIAIQFVLAAGFVITTIVLTHLIGPRRKGEKKLENTESGIKVIGNARLPFNIKYFVIAILFVMFDVEIIFMYPWAVNFEALGLNGLIEMFLFIGILLVGFFYIWRKGVFKWD